MGSCFTRKVVLAGWVAFLLLALSASADPTASASQEQEKKPEPFQLNLVEEAGIDLILLDVEVTDKDGRPIRGLGIEDFTMKIDGRVRKIYSVDDLCSCLDPPTPGTRTRSADLDPRASEPGEAPPKPKIGNCNPSGEPTGAPPGGIPGPAAAPIPTEPMLYTLYMNFGQLQQDGREHALTEARRWVRETMADDDQVQIVAWSSQAGLVELAPFTEDKKTLLEALENAEHDPAMNDPFPTNRTFRQERLANCWESCVPPACGHCTSLARQFAGEEFTHGRGSMEALQQTLYSLEKVPGQKTMLYFYQNDTLFPTRLYPGSNTHSIDDLIGEQDQVAADATLSRTSLVAAFAGSDPSGPAVNFGANLADKTGGSYSRAAYLMPEATDPAGRGCRCVYRIAVRPAHERNNQVQQASVWVRNRRVPRIWRVQHLGKADRWLRDAQAALRSPDSFSRLPITASLLPLSFKKGRWTAAVQVIVPSESLVTLPTAAGNTGSWETGALLYRGDGKDPREFLARSALRTESTDPKRRYIVHERILDNLRPGAWRLGAFTRDKYAGLFGGAKAEVILPPPGRNGLSTPILLAAGRKSLRTSLPVLRKKKQPPVARTKETNMRPVPVNGDAIRLGEPLEIRSWVCASNPPVQGPPLRFLTDGDGEPILRFDPIDPPGAGGCRELVDSLETAYLAPGKYTYHLRYGGLEEALLFHLPPTESSTEETSAIRRPSGSKTSASPVLRKGR